MYDFHIYYRICPLDELDEMPRSNLEQHWQLRASDPLSGYRMNRKKKLKSRVWNLVYGG